MSARMKLTVEQVAALEHHLRNHPFAGHPPHTHDEYRPIHLVDPNGPLGPGEFPGGCHLAAGGDFRSESEAWDAAPNVVWVEHRTVTYSHWTPTEDGLPPHPVEESGS